MKKITKFIISLACVLLIGGCNVYVYDIEDNQSTNGQQNNNSSNLTQNGTGTTIVTGNSGYSGTIKYTSQLPSNTKPWNEIYASVVTSVVTVRNIKNGVVSAIGSGVIFSEDTSTYGSAYIFTNAHVVEGSTSIEISLSNGILVRGTLIGYDKNEDVAVIKIAKRNDYSVATLRHSNTLRIGEEILTIGSPVAELFSNTATNGIISNLNIPITENGATNELYLIQIDAALNQGNSGGPLFDNGGNLIGINTLKLLNRGLATDIESFNYSIPISHFALVANYLLEGKSYYRPILNISIKDIKLLSMIERNQYNLSVHRGLLITKIDSNSALSGKASVNQVITHIQQVEIKKSSDFSVELLKYAPGDTISLRICNSDGTNPQTVNVTLLKK